MTIAALAILLAVVLKLMTPEERLRLVRVARDVVRRAAIAAAFRTPDLTPFYEALRARTRWPLATPAVVAANTAVFVLMLLGGGTLGDPHVLVAWGGNAGPETTNGEWWRAATSMFVHTGMLPLAASVVGLLQIGFLAESLVGSLAFAAVYGAAGILAGIVSLSANPLAVNVGASGAIFGIYGLFLAALLLGWLRRSILSVPVSALKMLAPGAAVFILWNVAGGPIGGGAGLAALAVGFVSGLVLTLGAKDHKPPVGRVGAVAVATVTIAVVSAAPLAGISDARPAIERVAAVEARTSALYDAAVKRFKHRRIGAEALVDLINRTIIGELQAVRAGVKALDGVPPEQQPLVAGAEEYFRQRDLSWRLRARGLRESNTDLLRDAEFAERASLDALRTIWPDGRHPAPR